MDMQSVSAAHPDYWAIRAALKRLGRAVLLALWQDLGGEPFDDPAAMSTADLIERLLWDADWRGLWPELRQRLDLLTAPALGPPSEPRPSAHTPRRAEDESYSLKGLDNGDLAIEDLRPAVSAADVVTSREMIDPGSLEMAKGVAEPAAVDVAELRLDAAVPNVVTVNHTFDLAVSVRQLSSPPLAEADLPRVRSGEVQVSWPEGEPFIRLRLRLSAPDCRIEGESGCSFRLYHGQDSPVFYFQLTPTRPGSLSIIVTVYQEDDWLGAARVSTTAEEQAAGQVKVRIDSQPLTPDIDHLRRLVDQHRRNLNILTEQKIKYGIRVPLDLENEIADEEQALAAAEARLAELEEK